MAGTVSPETVAGGVWARLVGQSHVVEQLRRAAATAAQFQGGHLDRAPAHAWLFTGPPGSGRSTAARAFAAALHCELAGTDAAGCGRCQGCRTTLAGSHPDVSVTVSQGSVLRAADVRPLIQLAQRAPTSGGWRVLIIEDADRLNDTSGNALLKAIEEPPERTLWLLCAPSVADVLVTIRSRCRSITLRTPPVADVADLLVRTHGIDPAMAAYAARAAQSHVGRARRLATDEQARIRRRDVVSLAFGLRGVGDAVLRAGHLVEVASEEAAAATTDRDAAEKADLLRALGYQEQTRLPPSVRAQVRDLETEQKRRAARFKRDMLDLALTDLASVYRDVAMLQLGASVELVNPTERAEISALARTSTPAHTLARLDAIATARTRLTSTNVNPLLAVEAMAIQLVGHEYGG